jgi:hypothetical protein
VGSDLRQRLFSNLPVKLAATGLAAAIWSTSFLSTGTTVRTVSVPVQFVSVPVGMDIAQPSFDRLEVEVRGSAWLMDSVSLTRLVASFNLRGASAGTLSLSVGAADFNLPPGIVMERVSPPRISVGPSSPGGRALAQCHLVFARPNTCMNCGQDPVLRQTSTSAKARRAGPGGPAQTWRSAPQIMQHCAAFKCDCHFSLRIPGPARLRVWH